MQKIEIIDKRKPREKHFLKKNGEFIAEVYDEDIHFLKDGKYEEIDNTLILKDNYYVNKNNSYSVKFNLKPDLSVYKLEKDGHYIEFSLRKFNDCNVKITNNSKYLSRIEYNNILKNIDLCYDITSSKLKENIMLLDKNNNIDDLCFDIKTDLTLKIDYKGTISATYENNEIFRFCSPYMVDNENNINTNISYDLINEGNNYELFMFIDKKWLKEEAKYPVTIDPTITNMSNKSSLIDTYIYENDTNVSRGELDHLKVGVEKVNNKDTINRTLLKFDLPTIGTGSQVVSANLMLCNYPYYTNKVINEIIDIHRITKDWTESSANWNTMNNAYDSRVEGSFRFIGHYITNPDGSFDAMYETADITSLVQKWYTSTPNYGILLKLSDEKYNNPIIPKFFSKNHTQTSGDPKPVLVINYRNQNGLEDYMNYEHHNIGRANIYHNTYNGNMTAVFGIGSTKTSKMPASLKLIYNTNDVVLNKNIGYGKGYKLNYNQTIKETIIDEKTYLEYDDEDGTIHYFLDKKKKVDSSGNIITLNEENTFYDEDGLDLKITKYDDKYILIDKNNNKMIFNKYNNVGYLTQIKDLSENIISIYYDSEYTKINKIMDSDNECINITFSENNTISIVSPDQTVTLSYTSSNVLESITYIDDTILISHNENHLINEISNISSKKVKYEYYDKIPYKLLKVSEYAVDNTLGNYHTIVYQFNSTTITTSKGKVKTITYNSFGNPQSISLLNSLNDITNAYGSRINYGDAKDGIDLNKNKLLRTQIPIKYVKNLLTNTSFEEDTTDFSTGELGQSYLSDEFANSGFKSLRFDLLYNIPSDVSTRVNVEKGKFYTFSAYVKTSVYNKPVRLHMYYENSEGRVKEVYSSEITPKDDFERLDATIFYEEDALSELTIAVRQEGKGICFIDDVQLEEGEVVNNYNLIENSDFSNGLTNWDLTSTKYDTNDVFEIVDVENQKALKINMHTTDNISLEKTFNIKGKAGDNYTLSFWYKNKGLNGKELFSDGPQNIVSIAFYPVNTMHVGDVIQNYMLNPNENGWQFFICNFISEYDFNSFKLSFNQYNDGNELYITNINLFKDVRSVIYNYDEKGNIIASKNLSNKTNKYDYDKNNELIKMTDPKGKILYYEYDNIVTNRVLRGVSETGISNEIEYDAFSNPNISRVVDRGQMITPKNGSYKIRFKGTNKLLRLINNSISLIDDTHGHDKWKIEKVIINEKDYYKIYHSIINDKYLTVYDNNLILSGYQDDNSLFELISKDNGSFNIKNKSSLKYLKEENNVLSLSDLIENDYTFEFYFESNENSEFIENKAYYTEDGKYITKIIDTNFNETKFDIDTYTKLMKSITNSKNQITHYNYNNKRQLQSIINKDKIVNYEYNLNNTLSKIIQDDRIYSFEYDSFLNIKSIKIGNIKLIDNLYEENNGNLILTTYGNNQSINYEYDEFDRIKKVIKEDDIYNYKYNNNGDLVKILSNNDSIKYTYDLSKRLYEYKFNDFSVRYNYDSNDNIISKDYNLDNINHIVNNILNSDDSIIKTTIDADEINYNYDDLGRLISSNINNNYNINYEYIKNGKRASMLVKSISNNDDKYSYKYDKLGNITHIYHNNKLENRYYYDDYNELIKEDNYILNKTIKYVYDKLGNILYKKECEINTDNQLNQYVYEYNNSNFKDQLTKVNNDLIVYDNLGNPIKVGDNITLTWINGRQLKKYEDENNTIEYKYNKDGIRISKKINDVETKYFLEGTHIILEVKSDIMLYYVRINNELTGFKYNDTMYYYVKNNQDDIIGILDSNYNLVAKYEYDSWGNIISILDENNNDVSNNNEHIANINPYRYRSYYYDTETKLYYLNSRYYNPKWCRFINVDGFINSGDIIKGNLYSYCANDPINNVDSSGQSFIKNVVNWVKKTAKKLAETVTKTIKNVVDKMISSDMNIVKDDPVVVSSSKSPIKKTVGSTTTTKIATAGNKNSLYKVSGNIDESNILLGDNSLSTNFSDINLSLDSSISGNGLSLTWKHNDKKKKFSIGGDILDLYIQIGTIKSSDDIDYENYTRYSVNLLIIIFAVESIGQLSMESILKIIESMALKKSLSI